MKRNQESPKWKRELLEWPQQIFTGAQNAPTGPSSGFKHGHVTRGILRANLQGKCGTLLPRPALCASLRSRNAHGHVTRGILEICRENAGRPGYHLD